MNTGWNWCDAVSAIASIAAVAGGCFTLKAWRRDKSRSQCEFVASLMDEMSKDGVQRILDLIATTDGTVIFNSSKVKESDESDLLTAVKFFSRICYLRDEKLISPREAKMFDGMMHSVACDKNIQSFLGTFVYRNGWQMDNNPYSLFLQYIKECDDAFSINYEDEIGKADNRNDEMLKESDFDQPTVVIKINRLWREGMTPDEIYEVTRGWWRVRLESANRARLALSVVNGKVVAAFAINRWVSPDEAKQGVTSRYSFEGTRIEDPAILEKYIGKSVKDLFPKGAANPIRYFNIK